MTKYFSAERVSAILKEIGNAELVESINKLMDAFDNNQILQYLEPLLGHTDEPLAQTLLEEFRKPNNPAQGIYTSSSELLNALFGDEYIIFFDASVFVLYNTLSKTSQDFKSKTDIITHLQGLAVEHGSIVDTKNFLLDFTSKLRVFNPLQEEREYKEDGHATPRINMYADTKYQVQLKSYHEQIQSDAMSTVPMPEVYEHLLKNVIPEEECRNLLLHNIAYHCINHKTPQTMFILMSTVGGIGKSMFATEVIGRLYGAGDMQNSLFNVVDTNSFSGHFNGEFEHKTCLFIEELSTSSLGKEQVYGNLKKVVGSPLLSVEAKYQTKKTVHNSMMVLAATNHLDPIVITDANDRRINVCYGSSVPLKEHPILKEYIDDGSIIERLDNEFDDFLKYLAGIKLSYAQYNRVIHNEYRDYLLQAHKSTAEQIAKAIINYDDVVLDELVRPSTKRQVKKVWDYIYVDSKGDCWLAKADIRVLLEDVDFNKEIIDALMKYAKGYKKQKHTNRFNAVANATPCYKMTSEGKKKYQMVKMSGDNNSACSPLELEDIDEWL
jgi:hypothetical protein